MNLKRIALGVLVLAAWIVPLTVEAASIKTPVRTGTVTMSTNQQTATLSPAVDTTKAFIVCSSLTDSSNASNRARCEITNGTTVTITTGVANANQTVRWHVAEFEGGVSVQRGVSSSVGACNNTTWTLCDVPISSVTTAQSFVLTSESTTSTSQTVDEEWTVRAELQTATNIRMRRQEAGIAVSVAWQVVSVDGAAVQRGLVSIGTSQASNTVNLGTAITPATSFLLFSRRSGTAIGGNESRYQVRGEITSGTVLTFTRANNPGGVGSTAIDIAWQVVSMDDGTAVQRATDTVGVGTATVNRAISSVDTTTTIPVISVSGGTSANTADLDATTLTAAVTTATNLALLRFNVASTTDQVASVAWQVISFFSCSSLGAVPNVGYVSATAQSGQVTVNWSSANPVLVLRKQGAFVAGDTPLNGKNYTLGAAVGSATAAFVGTGGETSFTDTSGITNGQTYNYQVFPKIAAGSASSCYATGAGSDVNGRPVAAGGNELWSYMLGGGSSLRAPLTSDTGAVSFASNSSRIVSLSTATGLQSWTPATTTQPVQGYIVWTTLSAGGEAVFGGDQSGRVYSIDAATGAENWAMPLASPADAIQAGTTIQIRAYSDSAFTTQFPGTYDVVFAATANNTGAFTTNNKVVALRSDTGAVLWTFNPCAPGCPQSVDVILGQPWIDYQRNYLFVASRAGGGGQQSLWVLDSLTGAVVTSFALGHLETAPTVSFDGATVWVGNKNGDLYAVDLGPATPALKWTAPLALGASASINGFVWEDYDQSGRIFFTTANGALRCFEDPGVGGTPNASTPCAGWGAVTTAVTGPTTVILLNTTLYVGSWTGAAGRVVPIDKFTGAAGTPFTVGDGTKQVGDMGTETGNEIFIGTTEGKVFKISLPLP